MSVTRQIVEYSRAPVVNGVIKGVKIVGNHSPRKGRDYPQAMLVKAMPLYERVPVHLLHGSIKERKLGQRKHAHHFGHIENVHEKPGHGGLYADLHIKQSHKLAGTIVESDGLAFGLSHEVLCTMNDAETEVTEILKVDSVDLVDDPATTHTLFEGYEDMKDLAELVAAQEASDTKIAQLAEGQGKIMAALESLSVKPPVKPPVKTRITALEQVTDANNEGAVPTFGTSREDFAAGMRGIAGGIKV